MNKRTKIIVAGIVVIIITVVVISCCQISMNKDGTSISNIGGTNESSSTLIEDNSQRGDNQVIYVYCRSGRRSKEASDKLATMGYKNIIECGGILDWTGEVEK